MTVRWSRQRILKRSCGAAGLVAGRADCREVGERQVEARAPSQASRPAASRAGWTSWIDGCGASTPSCGAQSQVTDRDCVLLGWGAEHGVLTSVQIAQVLFPSLDYAKSGCANWSRCG